MQINPPLKYENNTISFYTLPKPIQPKITDRHSVWERYEDNMDIFIKSKIECNNISDDLLSCLKSFYFTSKFIPLDETTLLKSELDAFNSTSFDISELADRIEITQHFPDLKYVGEFKACIYTATLNPIKRLGNTEQIYDDKLESKPFIQECFTDNGEHSHWQLRGVGGELLWSEDKENNDIIKQLDTWINNCKEQAILFKEQSMKTSEMCSDAMATAYNIVKEFLLKNK